MDKFKQIEGEDGLFLIKKVKVLYELIPMEIENFYIKRNLDSRRNIILKNK